MPVTAEILIPLAIDTAYSYAVPAGLALAEGDVVQVPLGPRETVGVVWALAESPGAEPAARHRAARGAAALRAPAPPRRLDRPLHPGAEGLGAARWRCACRTRPPPARPCGSECALRRKPPPRACPRAARCWRWRPTGRAGQERAGQGGRRLAGVVDGLIDDGALEAVALQPEPVALPPDPDHPRVPPLRGAGRAAARAPARRGRSRRDAPRGRDGSGKTEVYFEAVAECVRAGRQALILMPEIALTAQFLDRFAARFGVRPAAWHSGIGGKRRERIRAGVAAGEIGVVVGARSALFLPFARLGLIVVDEEHESAYKQEDGVHYHARDMAVVRGRLEGCPVVLASATPSIETRVNAARGRYRHVALPERFGGRRLPDIRAIDMRLDKPERGRFLAPPMIHALKQNLAAGEQSLLFLNRRGYAPLTLCRACGHRYQCRNCSTWLVEHRFRRALVCHQCGYAERKPEACVECGASSTSPPAAPASSASPRRSPSCFPDSAHRRPVERLPRRRRAPAGGTGDRGGRVRHRHRHAARRQGPQLPAPDPGGRARRRYRPDLGRSAGGRAHLPAPAAGHRPGGARRAAGPGPGPDLPARAPGHRRAPLRGRRALLRGGDRRPRTRRPAALRAPRGSDRLGQRAGGGGRPTGRRWPAPPSRRRA